MQETTIWKKHGIGKGVAAALFVMLAVWALGLLADVTRTEAEEIFLTPLLTDVKGWDMYVVENGSRREISTEEILEIEPGRVFYLSRKRAGKRRLHLPSSGYSAPLRRISGWETALHQLSRGRYAFGCGVFARGIRGHAARTGRIGTLHITYAFCRQQTHDCHRTRI